MGGPTHKAVSSDSVSLGDLPRVRRALNRAVYYRHLKSYHAPVQLWVSEFGWDSKGPDPGGLPLALHARWTSEALYRSWLAGVSVFIFHQLRDRPVPGFAYQSGLYFCGVSALADDPNCERSTFSFNSDQAKPALRAAAFPFVAFAANGRITIWGRTPNSLPGTVTIQRKTSAGYKKLFNISTNGYGIFTRRFSSSMSRGYLRASLSVSMNSLPFSVVRVADRPAAPWGTVRG
jgi:hypothetical protein